MMYGKTFKSMYEGSMYGAGVGVFAVWGYVISHADKSRVELNPKKLSDTLGASVKEIQGAIDYLCRPDASSRHKQAEGRRLVKEGEFQYFIPTWEAYQRIRNEEERREYNRNKKAESRAKKSQPLKGAVQAEKAYENGDDKAYDDIVTRSLPSALQ